MLNVAFCDDDKEFLSKIVPAAEKIFKYLRIDIHSHTFNQGDELISAFSKYQPYYDVVFLDIDMPNKNGKEVAKELRILDKKFRLVFITAYTKEALNTFQFDVLGFLPKNQISERLPEIIKLIACRIKEEDPKMQIFKADVNVGIMEIKIPLDDIIYFESINREVYLHTVRGSFILHNYRFCDIVKKFVLLGFVDIHRTCIVNIKYIFSIDELEVRLDNGKRLPLSRRKRQNVFDRFSNLFLDDELFD